MLGLSGAKCSDISHNLPPFHFREQCRNEWLHPCAWTAVFDNPKQFPVFPLFLKGAVREIRWQVFLHMRSRPVAFAADPVTEVTTPFAFVERFTRCDDLLRGRTSLSKGGLIAECLLHCGGGDSVFGRMERGASRYSGHGHHGWEHKEA